VSYHSHADLGGQGACGAIVPEPEDVLFHAAWEPRALALTLAMGATGSWNLDASRAARETLPDYAQLDYYRIWLAALEKLMAERGMVLPDEIAAGHALHPPVPVARVLQAAQVPGVLAKGSPTARPTDAPARFRVGQAVRMRRQDGTHHTRAPGYVQGRRGTIESVHGAHIFADNHAHGLGESPQWLYTVVFEGRELWGPATDAGQRVSVDAWESYLDAEPEGAA